MKKEALDYHEASPKGKIKVEPTKPHATAHELSQYILRGYTGCLEIAENPDDAYRYTSKGNLVAVISNGTAYWAWKHWSISIEPVMEEKGCF